MITTGYPGGRSRWAGALAAGAAVLVSAGVATVSASAPHPGPSDGGCVVGDVAGQVHCEGVLDNSLNNIEVHVLSPDRGRR